MSYTQGGSVFPAGFERVSDEPKQVFYDPFDAALDTTNLWNTPTVGNSAVLATVSAGTMSMGTGTTASGWSKLFSLPTFKLTVPAWTGFSFAITLPDGATPTANSYRFWGSGTIPTTPTTAAPLTDAVGFELSTAGKLYAVVYAAGVRTAVQDLSSTGNNKQPLDASAHRYIVYVRTDKAYWYIDGISDANLVATSNFQSPTVQTLPMAMLAVGASTPPVSNSQIQCMGAAVWDTGKNATQIADSTYPFRKATVNANGGLNITGVQTSPTTASWTSATGLNTAVTITVTTLNTITVVAATTSTFTGGAIIFEASIDNISWVTLTAARVDAMGIESTWAITANTIRAWSTSVDGFNYFRVRLSTAITGTGTLGLGIVAQTMPIEPIVNASLSPVTVGGASTFHLVSAASTNATVIKASAGQVLGWYIYNSNAAARKVVFHNSATTPTAGTGVVSSLVIPPTSGANVSLTYGQQFSAGIAITTVTGLTDADTTAVALNDLNINIFYA